MSGLTYGLILISVIAAGVAAAHWLSALVDSAP